MTEEAREHTATNIAMELVYNVAFCAGMKWKKELGEEAENMFVGRRFFDKETGKDCLPYGPFQKIRPGERATMFQWIIETAREKLQEFEDDENLAYEATKLALLGNERVFTLLFEGKKLITKETS